MNQSHGRERLDLIVGMRGLSQTRSGGESRMTVGAWRGPVGWYTGSHHHLTPHPCFQSKVFSLNRVQLTSQTGGNCARTGEVLGLISDSWNNYGTAEFRIHVQHKGSTDLFNWRFKKFLTANFLQSIKKNKGFQQALKHNLVDLFIWLSEKESNLILSQI